MDQVTGYLDEVLEGVRRNEDEKTLTKTMINNYVKSGLIESPVKKKYNQDQLMSLIMIYFLKGSTQIQEIETILKSFDDKSVLYNRFKTILDEELSKLEKVEKDTADEILRLLISSSLHKKYAERLIDQFLE
jgi:hypothetical protein